VSIELFKYKLTLNDVGIFFIIIIYCIDNPANTLQVFDVQTAANKKTTPSFIAYTVEPWYLEVSRDRKKNPIYRTFELSRCFNMYTHIQGLKKKCWHNIETSWYRGVRNIEVLYLQVFERSRCIEIIYCASLTPENLIQFIVYCNTLGYLGTECVYGFNLFSNSREIFLRYIEMIDGVGTPRDLRKRD